MANKKTGVYMTCPHCSGKFYLIKSRVDKSINHYCSLQCLSRFTSKSRADKIRKKIYPFVAGKCITCEDDIVVKNAQFDKPNRKFCSISCNTINTNKSMKGKFTEERKIRLAAQARRTFTGRELTKEHLEKKRISNLGEKSHFWRGGLTDKNRLLRTSSMSRNWRKSVFERDNYTCLHCKARSGKGKAVVLNADHILPWSTHPDLRFDLSNGRTLCLECHKKTDSFGGKMHKKLSCKP